MEVTFLVRFFRYKSGGAWLSLLGRTLVALGLLLYIVIRTAALDSGVFRPAAYVDFNQSFHPAAYAVMHPETQLYRPNRIQDNPFLLAFRLPPPAALYLAPFGLLPLHPSRVIWGIVTLLAYMGSMALLCHAFGIRFLSWPWLAALAAWSIFTPAYETLSDGQWNTLFLLLLSLATIGTAAERPILAAVPLAIAASVKPYPLLLAFYFVVKRWWRAIAILGATLVGVFAAAFAAIGLEESITYLTRVLPASGPTTAVPDNQSLGGLIARLATDQYSGVPLKSRWVDLAIRATAAVLVAAAALITYRTQARDGLGRALQFGLFMPLSVLIIPVAWGHYHTILLIPLFLLALELARNGLHARTGWLMLGLSFALLALGDIRSLLGAEVHDQLWRVFSDSTMRAADAEIKQRFPTHLSRLVLSHRVIGAGILLALIAWRVSTRHSCVTGPGLARTSPHVPA